MNENKLNIVLDVSGFVVFFFRASHSKKHYKTTATSTFPIYTIAK